jgi:hypothetical protein
MTNAKSHPAAPAIVLFGLDGQGRPLAATFAADQTALALKAATSLKLQTLKIETAEQTDLAKQLPVGAILAAGRATVPLVSKALFDKLLALRPTSADPPRSDAPAAASPQPSATASNQLQPKRSPATWAEIDVGDLVLVENWEPETGWYEAVVLEKLGDDEFKLRFRDYPEEGTLVRRRNQLALMSPAAPRPPRP